MCRPLPTKVKKRSDGDGKIILTEAVISEDGKQSVRVSAAGEELYELGERLAQLVLERGAGDLLAERAAQWET